MNRTYSYIACECQSSKFTKMHVHTYFNKISLQALTTAHKLFQAQSHNMFKQRFAPHADKSYTTTCANESRSRKTNIYIK